MNNYFVILAAGKGRRFDKNKPKQFFQYKNKEIIDHSIEKSLESKIFKKIVVVTNNLNRLKKKKYFSKITVIKGGKERSDSTLEALKYLRKFNPKNIFIHDAARPNFSPKLLKDLNISLKKHKAVVPIIQSTDSIKHKVKNKFYNLDKKNTFLTQTPQAFRFKDLYLLATNQKNKVADESSLYIDNDYKIRFINGEKRNNKITYKNDINKTKT